MAVMLSPGVYINEVDASTIAPSIANNVAFFAGNFTDGPVDYPYVVTSKTELERVFGTPTNDNYNEWFQCWKFFDYANQLVITRGYEFTDVSKTPVLSDYKYKAYSYENGIVSGNVVHVDVKLNYVFEQPKVAIGEWVSLDDSTNVGKITEIKHNTDDQSGLTLTFVISYDSAPAAINPSGDLYVNSLRFLNGETQAITRGEIDSNYVPVQAKAIDPEINIDAPYVIDYVTTRVIETANNVTLDNTTTDIDGVTLVDNDVVGVFAQTDPAEDGFYVVSTTGAWERVSTYDVGASVKDKYIIVKEGSRKGTWKITTGEVIGDDLVVTQQPDYYNPNYINQNRLSCTYNLIKNPNDWEYYYSLDDENPLKQFNSYGTEISKLKFFAKNPGDGEIEIAIANWYDFLNVNGSNNYAIAFRDQNNDVVEDIYLQSLFQYYPQKDQIAIAIRKGTEIETYIVSFDPNSVDGNGKSNYIENVINEQSNLVYVLDNQSVQDFPASYLVADRFGLDIDGNPNPGGVRTQTLTIKGGRTVKLTEGGLRDAYFSVEDKEKYEIDVIIGNEFVYADGDNLNIAIELADTRKDCIAFVGARYKDTVGKRSQEAVNAMVEYITENDPLKRNGSVKLTRSMFGAFFGNYFRIYDKYNKKYRWINVAGDMAGIRCSVSTANASWWVSAGMKRGVIRGIERMAFTPSQPQRDTLYKNGINPLVTFPGSGDLVWGNKTLYNIPSAFDRINVRNLFNTIERSMAKAAKSQVFEFNDVYTRNAILSMFNPYLATIKAGRGIQDYLVICDESNNPPEVIQRNELHVDIYIKPMFSAEFIQLTFTNVGTRSFASVIGTGV